MHELKRLEREEQRALREQRRDEERALKEYERSQKEAARDEAAKDEEAQRAGPCEVAPRRRRTETASERGRHRRLQRHQSPPG